MDNLCGQERKKAAMSGSELNDRLRRLQDICMEAREIIDGLEEYVRENSEYSQLPVTALEIPRSHFRTRFLNVCSVAGFRTVQDLIDYGRHRMSRARNVGEETLNVVSGAMMRQFGIRW